MKRTVELDTVEIADKLGELASKVSMLGLAANGMDCFSDGGGGVIANFAFEIKGEIEEIAREVHPRRPKEEIAFIKRQAERRIAEISAADVVEPDDEGAVT